MNWLQKRKRALQRLFRDQRSDYRTVFLTKGEANAIQAAVLSDLRSFCFAERRTAVRARDGRIDPIATALQEGRREVWLRINKFLTLSDEQLERIERSESNHRANIERDTESEYA